MINKKYNLYLVLVNGITFIRLIGAIILPFMYYLFGISGMSIVAFFLFITDFIDGSLARKLNCSTFFGALLDTICDKSLGIVSLFILASLMPIVYIPLVLEAIIFFVNIIKYKEGYDVQVSIYGKIKMWILSMTIIISFGILSFTKGADIANSQVEAIELLNSTLIVSQFIALGSYIIGVFKKPKFREEVIPEDLKKITTFKELKELLFDHEFYLQNRDMPLKRLLYVKK